MTREQLKTELDGLEPVGKLEYGPVRIHPKTGARKYERYWLPDGGAYDVDWSGGCYRRALPGCEDFGPWEEFENE